MTPVLEKPDNSNEAESDNKDSDEEEEWTPPEYVDHLKFFMDGFRNKESAESKIFRLSINLRQTIENFLVLRLRTSSILNYWK